MLGGGLTCHNFKQSAKGTNSSNHEGLENLGEGGPRERREKKERDNTHLHPAQERKV